MPEVASVATVQSAITDEIFFALGLGRRGFLRRSLGWVFALPTRRFARFMTAVDAAMGEGGSPAGCRVMMESLQVKIDARDLENIPIDGPVMILANHPGAYDSMAIGSLVPRRDLKAIVTGTRLYDSLPNLRPNVFFVSRDPGENMQTLRDAIDHLRGGGLLLQFGSGKIEPDPATDPVGDEVFAQWSSSVEIMLRKVPGLHSSADHLKRRAAAAVPQSPPGQAAERGDGPAASGRIHADHPAVDCPKIGQSPGADQLWQTF